MIYLLDTNVCIRYLNGQSDSIRRHVKSLNPEDIALCSVVKAELFYGAMKSANPEKNLIIYGGIRSELEKTGAPIGPNDIMIAAIAVQHDITLVTHNTKEFGRVKGLKTADWEV